VYMVVIFVLWHAPGVRNVLNPLKLFTIGWHELCHIIMGIMTGGRIISITIDPNLGGCTRVEGGRPWAILSAGYIGSTFFGAIFILAGWDTLVSKIMSFFIGIGLLCPLVLVRDKLTILLTVAYEALLVGFWFADHAEALRYYCLFIGIMNIFYAVWDLADDKFFHKVNDSDATQFEILYPKIRAHVWALFWIFFEICVLVGFILIGIVGFKRTPQQMFDEAAGFLPT